MCHTNKCIKLPFPNCLVLFLNKSNTFSDDEPREQHQGVHGSKMGNEDVHLHVQGEHETGGHWCAKLFFFSLLAILLGLIGLIILENRGLADCKYMRAHIVLK